MIRIFSMSSFQLKPQTEMPVTANQPHGADHFRFLTARKKLTDKELDSLTASNAINHVAVGALFEGAAGPEAAGIARYICLSDRTQTAQTGKPHKIIVTAVARKLVTIVNALCKSRQKWEHQTQ